MALNEYEGLLRERGALVVDSLRPGVAPKRIAELEQEFGFAIPDEVKAVWLWHDGLEGIRSMVRGPALQLTAFGGGFGDLELALQAGRRFVEIMFEGQPETEYSGKKILSLLIDNVGIVIDVTPGEAVLTYMNDPAAQMHDYPVLPLAERIGWWSWAIENGAWSLKEDGSWAVDYVTYPDGPNRNVF